MLTKIDAAWMISLLFAWGSSATLVAQTQGADTLLQAMQDEIGRSNQLRIISPDVPYFVQYRVFDGRSFTISATLGALLQSDDRDLRLGEVMVRVGDYSFDNGNYAMRRGGNGLSVQLQGFVKDESYTVFRRILWLGTDEGFKDALETISAKRAALKNIKLLEELPDFAKAEPVKLIQPKAGKLAERKVWEARVKELSAMLRANPVIHDVTSTFQHTVSDMYLANSEGTMLRVPGEVVFLRVRAEGQAPDGMLLRDQIALEALSADRLPDWTTMKAAVETLGQNFKAISEAPWGENYVGPVLFEGQSAPQLFAQLLGSNLSLTRRLVTDPGAQFPFQPSEFEGRIGSRVLPESMNVVDDPTAAEFEGHPLIGRYDVDIEGIKASPLTLVDKGILKDVLRSRQPVKGYDTSNGRGRLPGAYGVVAPAPSNLLISAAEGLSNEDLKKKLLDLISQRQKPYGVIVRSLDFPTSADIQDLRRLMGRIMQSGGSARIVSPPVLVYKVYPDGKEELIRGMQFRNLSARSLRDILAVSQQKHVFHYFNSGAPLGFAGFGGIVAETSIVAPSVLLEEVELEVGDRQLPTLHLVPPYSQPVSN